MSEKLRKVITDAQDILARYIVPDSGITEHECVNQLLGLLDGPQAREALAVVSAIEPSKLRGEERRKYIHDHDCPKVWEFFNKHSGGSKLCPSCLMCGQQYHDREDWGITHLELPDIYICKPCVAKARAAGSSSSFTEQAAWLVKSNRGDWRAAFIDRKHADEDAQSERIAGATEVAVVPLYETVPSAIRAQGPCETTLTPRFEIKDCACGTYEGNLGPCLTWNEGNEVGRCVFCAHGLDCHVKLSKLLASEKHQDDPKNANLAALVLKLDKHISLHEMFAPEWEAIAAAARIAMDRTGA